MNILTKTFIYLRYLIDASMDVDLFQIVNFFRVLRMLKGFLKEKYWQRFLMQEKLEGTIEEIDIFSNINRPLMLVHVLLLCFRTIFNDFWGPSNLFSCVMSFVRISMNICSYVHCYLIYNFKNYLKF